MFVNRSWSVRVSKRHTQGFLSSIYTDSQTLTFTILHQVTILVKKNSDFPRELRSLTPALSSVSECVGVCVGGGTCVQRSKENSRYSREREQSPTLTWMLGMQAQVLTLVITLTYCPRCCSPAPDSYYFFNS